MGKTHTKREEARSERLKQLPRSERLAKIATIKKKEGRVLDASEKHALKMTTEYGEIVRLWEVLRTSTDPNADPAVIAKRAEKKRLRDLKRREKKATSSEGSKLRTTFEDDDGDDSSSSDDETATAPKALTGEAPQEEQARTVDRYEYKYPVIDKLMSLIAPKFATMAKTPRVSRVIQSMIKFGSPAHLEKLLSMMSSDFLSFCNDAFSHFAVCALMRHAPHALHKKLVGLLIPSLPQIVTHKFGVQVVHAAYSSRLCSTMDRNMLLLGIFKDGVAVMKHYRGYPVLEDILQQELDHQKRLVQRLFEISDKLVSQKEAFTLPFVQRLVFAFLRYGTKHEILEMSVTLKPHLVALCESREGSELAALTFALLEPKARKDALRAVGENLSELLVGKYSSPVVARLFDLMYDAQLLHKFVAAGVEHMMEACINSPYGYQVLLHLVTPEGSRRERLLSPAWLHDYNLYSSDNANWNTHTWLNVEYQKETVEICSKPAQRTHLSVLKPLVQKVVSLVADEASRSKLNKLHVGLIAREILHVVDTLPQYQQTLALSSEDIAALQSVLPKKDQKRMREEGDATAEGASAETPAAKAPRLSADKAPSAKKVQATPAKKKAPSATATSPAVVDEDAPVERSARTPQQVDSTPTAKAPRLSSDKASSAKKAHATPAKKKAPSATAASPVERSARASRKSN
eukprot:CAMPEP_0176441080 /NCGR_PEP_ID=MMETSP0127-20121128/20977_1 /TAXON_ID=938130 /ORGANISM="Platyophrya macrostoma, Strain WH" /LENGTH=689 /DNA_ID=CAMNT_0017825775 /DNA_START=42 /DNA_END=2111 /DNA_ORIENTATION=+